MKVIKKIVLTGGPCAGKTTAISRLSGYLAKYGWRVLVVDEAATRLINAGLLPMDFEECTLETDRLTFQYILMKSQIDYETDMFMAAQKLPRDDKILIVCDRGIRDNAAYISPQEFKACLQMVGHRSINHEGTYDAIFHLVTAADGAEAFYTLDNNAARSEGILKAKELDTLTQNAWVGNGHMRVIKNIGSFDDKMRRLLKEVADFLGEPEPHEVERKFLIKYPDLLLFDSMPNCQKVQIMQTYLNSPGDDENRVRQRSFRDNYIFTRTTKRQTLEPGVRVEVERRITREEYLYALNEQRPGMTPICKDRYCIMHRDDGHYYEVDVYPTSSEYAILEVELPSMSSPIDIPEYLEVVREVTTEPEFSNFAISKNGNRLPV